MEDLDPTTVVSQLYTILKPEYKKRNVIGNLQQINIQSESESQNLKSPVFKIQKFKTILTFNLIMHCCTYCSR